MVEQHHGLRWAAGIALAAVGATAIYDRFGRRTASGVFAGVPRSAEFAQGRGTPQGPVDPNSKQAGYELADTNVRSLVIVMIVAIALMVAGVAGVFVMFASFDRHFIAQSARDTSEQRAAIVPPLPHLQADPYRDIDAMLMEQGHQLTTYGWTDAAHTLAHIPIERAMRQVVGKPFDSPATVDAAGPVGTDQALPARTVVPQAKPADHVQGEGRPGAIAPSYDPTKDKPGEK